MDTIPLWIVLILYFSTWLLLPVVITKKKRPANSVAWIMAIVFLPFIGPFFFAVFGTERIVNKGRIKLFSNQKLREHLQQLEKDWPPVLSLRHKEKLPRELEDIVSLSRKFGLFDAVGSNRVDILVDARDTYKKMEEAILSARHHINMEYYIFRPDKVGARFRDLLVKKAHEGVKVNFLYDAVGSRMLGWHRSFMNSLREGGIEPQDFLPLRTFTKPWNLNLRNHRKLLVVDDKIGFTGSLNIGQKFLGEKKRGKKWRETHLMIQGPAVTQLQWIFCEDWYFSTGEELLMPEYFRPIDQAGNEIVQVVASGPDVREQAIHKVVFAAVSQAKKSIYLTTPYFIPDPALYLALQVAARRGVEVIILAPRKSDHTFVTWAGRSYYDELLESGVKIFDYLAGNLHAKMLIVDSQLTIIGSANVDIRSFDYDFEVNVQVYGETTANLASGIFFRDLKNSRDLSKTDFLHRSALKRFNENVCRLFSPVM